MKNIVFTSLAELFNHMDNSKLAWVRSDDFNNLMVGFCCLDGNEMVSIKTMDLIAADKESLSRSNLVDNSFYVPKDATLLNMERYKLGIEFRESISKFIKRLAQKELEKHSRLRQDATVDYLQPENMPIYDSPEVVYVYNEKKEVEEISNRLRVLVPLFTLSEYKMVDMSQPLDIMALEFMSDNPVNRIIEQENEIKDKFDERVYFDYEITIPARTVLITMPFEDYKKGKIGINMHEIIGVIAMPKEINK